MSATPRPQPTRISSRRRRAVLAVLLAVYVVTLCEGASRLYWASRGVPLLGTRRIETAYFASLREAQVLERSLSRDDETFDVLLLGGSVLHRRFGTIADELEYELERSTPLPVRIHNLAEPGHTSRDSLRKYRLLDRQRFDLVVVYHGINDARQNNASRERFRDDYSHSGWYRKLALTDRHPERGWLILPYSLECAWVSVREACGGYLPRDVPAGGWGPDCEDVKTAGPFESNIEEIATLAERRGDPLVLMTFAHQAERYLPYAHLTTGISAWGTPQGVLSALNAHRDAVLTVAARHPEVLCIDQSEAIPKTDVFFADPCHLTKQGCRLWVARFGQALRENREWSRAGESSSRGAETPEEPGWVPRAHKITDSRSRRQ